MARQRGYTLTSKDLDRLQRVFDLLPALESLAARRPEPRRVEVAPNVQLAKASSATATAGRYPGHWYAYDFETKAYTQKDECWLVLHNGTVPDTSKYYEGSVQRGFLASDGKPIFGVTEGAAGAAAAPTKFAGRIGMSVVDQNMAGDTTIRDLTGCTVTINPSTAITLIIVANWYFFVNPSGTSAWNFLGYLMYNGTDQTPTGRVYHTPESTGKLNLYHCSQTYVISVTSGSKVIKLRALFTSPHGDTTDVWANGAQGTGFSYFGF